MSDLGTYSGFKNWLIGILVSLVFGLLAMIAGDNRRRIEVLEVTVRDRTPILESHGARIARLEEAQGVVRQEMYRRLDRIESKLDRMIP